MTNLKVMEAPVVLAEQWWFGYFTRTVAISGWIAAVALCGWLGFQVTRYWIPNPHEELLLDLPVIENLDQYLEARDIEFLQQLKKTTLFDDAQEK